MCLSHAKRDIEKAKRTLPKDDIKFAQLVSDVEILEKVETESNNSTHESVLNMNDIEKSYVCLLEGNGFTFPDYPRYKPYLKQLILDNIPDVHFTRPPDKTKPEQVLSTKAKETLLAGALASDPKQLREDVKVLLEAAKILSKDIANAPPWKIQGTFDNYEPSALLQLFCKHAIQGLHEVKTTRIKVRLCWRSSSSVHTRLIDRLLMEQNTKTSLSNTELKLPSFGRSV